MWLRTGQGSCQSPKSQLILHASKRLLGSCRAWRSLCWPQREEAGVCCGDSVLAGIEEKALSWGSGLLGSSPPLPPNSCSVVSMTTRRSDQLLSQAQGLAARWRQPGGGPRPSAYSRAAPGLGLEAESLRVSDGSLFSSLPL